MFAYFVCIMLSGCSSHTNETFTVANPKGPFQCSRDNKQFDCLSQKELERLIEAERYW